MTKEDLRTLFHENVNRSSEVPPELRETIKNINSMAHKLCGSMMVNCGDSPNLRRHSSVSMGSLFFHDALVQTAKQEVNAP
jgi:hypothetical protein